MKVLVLGWEYPPQVAGGLGAACEGLTTALAGLGHDVILAVPAGSGAEEVRDHPGIERVEIPLGVGAARPALLSPYAPVQPAADASDDAAPRAGARALRTRWL